MTPAKIAEMRRAQRAADMELLYIVACLEHGPVRTALVDQWRVRLDAELERIRNG